VRIQKMEPYNSTNFEHYLKVCWILKIRLQSCRLLLWKNSFSVIDLESSALQLRKSIESVAQLCIVLGDIEHSDLPKRIQRDYRADDILKHLKKADRLVFPHHSRLYKVSEGEDKEPGQWKLDVTAASDDDTQKILLIYRRCQQILHDHRSYHNSINGQLTPDVLFSSLNAMRADNQWIWNRFWQHSSMLQSKLFFVNFGDDTKFERPSIVKQEGLFSSDLRVDFEPNSFADFHEPIVWSSDAQMNDQST
jgi:hypothetical protein